MNKDETFFLPLTGEKNYKINRTPGQGSLLIGTKGISTGKYDVWIDEGFPVNWDAFNECFTPYGKQNAEKYPYGNWPRFFEYSGNDTGFVEWAFKRPIEEFHWCPQDDVSIDLRHADISFLYIHAEENKIEISIGDAVRKLSLLGKLPNFEIPKCDTIPALSFSVLGCQEENGLCRLPLYEVLAKARFVEISNSPAGPAFDCTSLLQFQNLASVDLWGNMAHLEALEELENLEAIGLRYVPDLGNMPRLAAWKNLNHFIGWNIEETAGKAFRAELKELKKEREFSFASVSKLRKPIWFTTEYGIPFSGWEDKKAKAATRAYKACLKEVKKAVTEQEVQEAITKFVQTLNSLPDMETTGREDAGTAVSQLVASSALGISPKTGSIWFDEAREF